MEGKAEKPKSKGREQTNGWEEWERGTKVLHLGRKREDVKPSQRGMEVMCLSSSAGLTVNLTPLFNHNATTHLLDAANKYIWSILLCVCTCLHVCVHFLQPTMYSVQCRWSGQEEEGTKKRLSIKKRVRRNAWIKGHRRSWRWKGGRCVWVRAEESHPWKQPNKGRRTSRKHEGRLRKKRTNRTTSKMCKSCWEAE